MCWSASWVGTTAAALVWSQAPTYTANAVLFVSTPNDQSDASQAYQGGLFSQQRVQSYVEIVSSPPVVSAVKKQLGLDESVQTLQGRITASAPLNTVLIDVSVKDRRAEPSRLIPVSCSAPIECSM
jgi:capsular polysaccharide biosynthesis protein